MQGRNIDVEHIFFHRRAHGVAIAQGRHQSLGLGKGYFADADAIHQHRIEITDLIGGREIDIHPPAQNRRFSKSRRRIFQEVA